MVLERIESNNNVVINNPRVAEFNKSRETLGDYIDFNLRKLSGMFQRNAKALLDLGATPEFAREEVVKLFTKAGIEDFDLPEDEARAISEAAIEKQEYIPEIM